MQHPEEAVASLRNSFKNGTTKPLPYRLKQLNNLLRLYDENGPALCDALRDDLNKHPVESHICEIEYCKNDVRGAIYNVEEWSQPREPSKPLANVMDRVELHPEPYGVVLVIGAWNYPLSVAMTPLCGAIAAGNCVLLKPSELAPTTAKLLAELVPKYLDPECCKVVLGGPEDTSLLLKQRFDYIFFTGSTRIGRIVSEAAAKNLTPTTLELGGKSPCYVDETVDVELAAARIIWGKSVNCGQTCIAPDYLLCNRSVEEKIIPAFKKALKTMYGEDIRLSDSYGRLINDGHLKRLVDLLKDQKIAIGGEVVASERYISPTVCIDVDSKNKLMEDEIFGPILPIVRVENASEAISFINGKEKPLAMYVFSKNQDVVDMFVKETSAGGVTINDTVMHFACEALPFGGVGASGMGSYHGKYSFETFTHLKPVLKSKISKFGEMLLSSRYPPYSQEKFVMLQLLLKNRKPLIPTKYFKYLYMVVSFYVGYQCSLYFNRKYDC